MRFVTIAFLSVLAACSGDGDKTDAGDTSDTGAPATDTTSFDDAAIAADLWDAIQGYESWGRPAGWSDTPAPSGSHMGAYVVRYDDATLAAWDGSGTAPEGSISVKEEYGDAGATLAGITVMQKIAGYDPAGSDWFWVKYLPDGAVEMSGQVAMCSGCHAAAPQDYLHTDPPAM